MLTMYDSIKINLNYRAAVTNTESFTYMHVYDGYAISIKWLKESDCFKKIVEIGQLPQLTVYQKLLHKARGEEADRLEDLVNKINTCKQSGITFVLRDYLMTIKKQLPDELVESLNETLHPIDKTLNMNDVLSTLMPTPVQELVSKFTDLKQRRVSSFLSTAGSGKTKAALHAISKIGQRALILSTRSAVNDQWITELSRADTSVRVFVKGTNVDDYDIFVLTPQYVLKHLDDNLMSKILQRVNCIVYDELHSLSSLQFAVCLLLPQYYALKDGTYCKQMYKIGLTATQYANGSVELTRSEYALGMYIGCPPAELVGIPVHYTLDTRGDPVVCAERYVMNLLTNYPTLFTSKVKGLILTMNIVPSVNLARLIHNNIKTSILLVRAVNEPSYFIYPNDKFPKEVDSHDCHDSHAKLVKLTLESLKNSNIQQVKSTDLPVYIDRANIIIGTLGRLKEGFNCEDIGWGVCANYVYSYLTRVQILGRIRRTISRDNPLFELLTTMPRFMHCIEQYVEDKSIEVNGVDGVTGASTTYTVHDKRLDYPIEFKPIEDAYFKRENYILDDTSTEVLTKIKGMIH